MATEEYLREHRPITPALMCLPPRSHPLSSRKRPLSAVMAHEPSLAWPQPLAADSHDNRGAPSTSKYINYISPKASSSRDIWIPPVVPSDTHTLSPPGGKQNVFHMVDKSLDEPQLVPTRKCKVEAQAKGLRTPSRPSVINDRNNARPAMGGEASGVSGVPLIKVKLKAGTRSPKLELPFLLFPPKFTIAELTKVIP